MNLTGQKIVVVVAGGIAAYKAADLVSRLRREEAEVRVVMTRSAREFVAPLTFEALSGHPVYDNVFEQPSSWEMEHISWARWAHAVVVAPATANLLAKMALGLADDAASTLLLAYQGPVWVAPSMNTAMLAHSATQHNISTLRARDVRFIEPDSGRLACGEVGVGRMAEPEVIVQYLIEGLSDASIKKPEVNNGPLAGKRVLVTAGPTSEMLDPIRYISNRSSGRMGVVLSAEARALGARVALVHGPMSAAVPLGVDDAPVTGAREMLEAVRSLWAEVDIAIFAAAVANYESSRIAGQKLKEGDTVQLKLRRTPDIARWAGENRRDGQILAGFAAESENLLESAQQKLTGKKLDLIFANVIGQVGIGFEAEKNQVTLLDNEGARLESPVDSKERIAVWIWARIIERLPGES